MGAALALLVSGCVGLIGDDGSTTGGGPSGGVEGAAIGQSPLRLLTRAEYNNTVRDVLGDTTSPADVFGSEDLIEGYAANAQFDVNIDAANDLLRIAEDVTARAIATTLADAATIDTFLDTYGRRLFRRPLSDADRDDYVAMYEQEAHAHGHAAALELVLSAMLMSPRFLYHLENDGLLDAYAMASRLSYFIWHSSPDDVLLDAAGKGELQTAGEVSAQARRMVGDARADGGLTAFYTQWLHLDNVVQSQSGAVGTAMRDEALAFVRHVMAEEEGSLEVLLTADYTFVNDELATVYGMALPGSDELVKVPTDPSERAGLLTQGWFVAGTTGMPLVNRGKLIRERMLCQRLGSPPANLDDLIAEFPDPDRLSNPACSTCHQLMDPIGQGFGQYAQDGSFQQSESNVGFVADLKDELGALAGEFAGPAELSHKLLDAEVFRHCVAEQWLTFALRRHVKDAEVTIDPGDDLEQLVVDITTTDAFRSRRIPGEE